MIDEKIAVLMQNPQQHVQRLPIIDESRFLYVDMDNVLVDFPSGIPHLSATVVREYENRLDEVPGIFALMTPMPCAIESFFELPRSSIPTFCLRRCGRTLRLGQISCFG